MSMITMDFPVSLFDSPKEAPHYDSDTTMLRIERVLIVGRGTESGKPTADLQLVAEDGRKFLVMTTGALLEMLGGACAGKRLASQGN